METVQYLITIGTMLYLLCEIPIFVLLSFPYTLFSYTHMRCNNCWETNGKENSAINQGIVVVSRGGPFFPRTLSPSLVICFYLKCSWDLQLLKFTPYKTKRKRLLQSLYGWKRNIVTFACCTKKKIYSKETHLIGI